MSQRTAFDTSPQKRIQLCDLEGLSYSLSIVSQFLAAFYLILAPLDGLISFRVYSSGLCMHCRNSKAFTLVELLVVIAIIGILIGILLPAVQQVREAARRAHCLNNLRQVGLATHSFHDANGAFPPARLASPFNVLPGDETDGPESWFVRILPYVEQNNLFDLWDLSRPYETQPNQAVATPVSTFLCASRHQLSDANAPSAQVSGGGG